MKSMTKRSNTIQWGGIMFEVIINGDKKITGSMGLRKRSEDGPIRSVGLGTSVGFQELMEE